MLPSTSPWMIDWRSLKLHASMACFGRADAQSDIADPLVGVSVLMIYLCVDLRKKLGGGIAIPCKWSATVPREAAMFCRSGW